MGQTLALLSPQTAAGVSADIVVGAAPVTLLAYTADGLFPSGLQIFVDRKIGAYWQEEGTMTGKSMVANAPGTYRLRKGATSYAVGFGKDEV